jgi:carboxylesterase 2
VQKNIAQFGGDPSKVLIFGESAGGESVKQLLANPPSPLPFASAILESEQALLIGDGTANYQNVSAHFGCSTIQCLRQVSATDIKAYIEVNSLAFPPVQNDGTSISDIRASISSGKFAKVPIMMGTNLNEIRGFLDVDGISGNGTAAVDTLLAELGINSTAAQNNIISQYAADIVDDTYALIDR